MMVQRSIALIARNILCKRINCCINPASQIQRTLPVKLIRRALATDASISLPSLKRNKFGEISMVKLTEKLAEEELRRLNSELLRHDNLYYNEANPEISDNDYDRMIKYAFKITQKYPSLRNLIDKSVSVGAPKNSTFEDFQHQSRMKSLKNVFSISDLRDFCNDVLINENSSFVIEPKIDGVSLSLIYVNGTLKSGGTRGDGYVGDDVTPALRLIPSIPKSIPLKTEVNIRGELYMNNEDFESFKTKRELDGRQLPMNPRNSASGLLRHNSPQPSELKLLHFFAFSALKNDSENNVVNIFDTQMETLSNLKSMGFEVADGYLADNVASVISLCKEAELNRVNYNFPTDGAVVKLNIVREQVLVGEAAKYPKWAVAFKFTDEVKPTILREIKVQVSRAGVLTPVAVFDPVILGRTTISRATLHNEQEINRLKLQIGAKILVKKSGQVIPKVVGLDKKQPSGLGAFVPYKLPCRCPSCGNLTHTDENDLTVCGATLTCPSQLVESIRHFCHFNSMNIIGLGPGSISDFLEAGIIQSLSDIFTLRDHANEIKLLPNWGPLSTERVIQAIESCKQVETYRLLNGLGIKYVGLEKSKKIASCFPNFNALWSYLCSNIDSDYHSPKLDLLRQIPDIGPRIIDSLIFFAKDPTKKAIVDVILQHVETTTTGFGEGSQSDKNANKIFLNQKVVFTGGFSLFKRATAVRFVTSQGGIITSRVTASTNLVVRGKNVTSNVKIAAAQKHFTKVWTEEEFIAHTGLLTLK